MSGSFSLNLDSPNGPSNLELWLNFISQLISAIAWPIAIVIVALIFKKPILRLLQRVRRASFGDAAVEFELDELFDRTESKVAELEQQPSIEGEQSEDVGFERTVKQSPKLAVLNDWIRIEEAITKLAQQRGYTGPRARSFSYALRHLIQDGVIGVDLDQVIKELRAIRNIAVHEPTNVEITAEEASRFHEMSAVVISRITSLS